jgi:hypothetical protein
MVSLCREQSFEMNVIFFISSKCNLDPRQRLKGRFFYFYRVFSIKRRLKYVGLLFLHFEKNVLKKKCKKEKNV